MKHASQAAAILAGREKAALTQVQAAHGFGLGLDTWRSYEHGRRVLPDGLRRKLVKAWGLDLPKLCPCCGQVVPVLGKSNARKKPELVT